MGTALLANFVITNSFWLVVGLVAVVTACTALIARAGRPETVSPASPRARRIAFAVVPSLIAAAIVGLLIRLGTASATIVLLLLALLAAWYLAREMYRTAGPALTGRPRRACIFLRLAAITIILLMLTRPTWSQAVIDWDRPLLVVLLDQSRSMSLIDAPERQSRASRSEIANEAFDSAARQISRLRQMYEVRLLSLGEMPAALDAWKCEPQAPSTAIAVALRAAAQARSSGSEPPVGVLLVSDGAENAADPAALTGAAQALAAQKTALLAVGVGPAAAEARGVAFDALIVPARVAPREKIHLTVSARVTGYADATASVELLWDQQSSHKVAEKVDSPAFRLRREFEIEPPGPGLHRLAARVTLPVSHGNASYETSTIVDVREERIRVLLLDGRARSEMAFAARALRADPRFVVSQFITRIGATGDAPNWSEYDVVVFGDVPERGLSGDALARLAERVRDHGLGLLVAGGPDVFHNAYYARSELAEILPVMIDRGSPPAPGSYRPRFVPTPAGLEHAALKFEAPEIMTQSFAELPELGGAAQLGRSKPLATILGADAEDRAMLVVHEVGRGRSAAAAWESTWPWALHSDAGAALHKRLWRQMALWLANRRPSAWIVTDQTEYTLSALTAGRSAVAIRAGVAGVDASIAGAAAVTRPRLTLKRVGLTATSQMTSEDRPLEIPIVRKGDEWVARLPEAAGARAQFADGEYELEFSADLATGAGESPIPLSARTRFRVQTLDRELLPPTHNLALLREAAEATAAVGGEYRDVSGLSALLERLAGNDRRRQIERLVQFDPVARHPWVILGLLCAALLSEWLIRKRAGLA